MPKKGKKGKGKKKGKGEKKGPPPPAVSLDDDTVNESSKQYYTTQIKDLEERLSRYQAKCDKLELNNSDLEKRLHQQVEDQEQMISFLKRKAHDQTERFVDLEDRLHHAQQVKDEQQQKLEAQVAQLKEESQRALDQAVMENKILQGQLESLETFRQNKERIEREMVEKDEEIERLKKEHSEELYQLEKKAVLDRDRMMKEMVVKVNCVAAEFRKVSDIQMAETTKRAIRENVSVNQQMNIMSEKTMELLKENERLKKSERDVRRSLEVLEDMNKYLARKNISGDKLMTMFKEKAVEQEAWSSQLEGRIEHCIKLEKEATQSIQEASDMSHKSHALKMHITKLEEEIALLNKKLEEKAQELHRLHEILTQSATAIQASLQLQADPTSDDTAPQKLLPTLLLLLAECKPDLGMTGYQPGNMGLVPAPSNGSNSKSPFRSPLKTQQQQHEVHLPPIRGKRTSLTTQS